MTLQHIVKIAYQVYSRSPEAEKYMDQNMDKLCRRFFCPIADMKGPMLSETTIEM